MVAVLQPLTPKEWSAATGKSLGEGETGMVLARPKLSYCPPASDILIARKGYAFSHTTRVKHDPDAKQQANCDEIVCVLVTGLDEGTRHTQRSLEALNLMPRTELRDAVSLLVAHGRVQNAPVPDRQKGGSNTYLQPIAAPSHASAP